jgi:hypothetical protein
MWSDIAKDTIRPCSEGLSTMTDRSVSVDSPSEQGLRLVLAEQHSSMLNNTTELEAWYDLYLSYIWRMMLPSNYILVAP